MTASRTDGAQGLIQQLLDRRMSKWRIAKEIGVSWQTVHMWAKGIFQPVAVHRQALQKLLQQK